MAIIFADVKTATEETTKRVKTRQGSVYFLVLYNPEFHEGSAIWVPEQLREERERTRRNTCSLHVARSWAA